jgi:hypothetical protein
MTFILIGGRYISRTENERKIGSFPTYEKARQQVKFYEGYTPTASFIIDGVYFDYYDIRIED